MRPQLAFRRCACNLSIKTVLRLLGCIVTKHVHKMATLIAFLVQVSSQARTEGRKEAHKLLAGLRSSTSSSVRLAVALALRECLYFDGLCRPGLADLCCVLSSGDSAGSSRTPRRPSIDALISDHSPCLFDIRCTHVTPSSDITAPVHTS